ncbi:hypothetical protein LTR49_027498 [Elasticomyces elasticus]|nr:hypothetical protein LTR49_027498 [Elasticomyces elasticus]
MFQQHQYPPLYAEDEDIETFNDPFSPSEDDAADAQHQSDHHRLLTNTATTKSRFCGIIITVYDLEGTGTRGRDRPDAGSSRGCQSLWAPKYVSTALLHDSYGN